MLSAARSLSSNEPPSKNCSTTISNLRPSDAVKRTRSGMFGSGLWNSPSLLRFSVTTGRQEFQDRRQVFRRKLLEPCRHDRQAGGIHLRNIFALQRVLLACRVENVHGRCGLGVEPARVIFSVLGSHVP